MGLVWGNSRAVFDERGVVSRFKWSARHRWTGTGCRDPESLHASSGAPSRDPARAAAREGYSVAASIECSMQSLSRLSVAHPVQRVALRGHCARSRWKGSPARESVCRAECRCGLVVGGLLSFPKVFFRAQQFKLTFEASEEASESRNPEGCGPQPAASVWLIDQIAKMTFGKLCRSLLQKWQQRFRWSPLDVDTAPTWAVAPSEGQIIAILGAFDCRFRGPREPTDFFNRLLTVPRFCRAARGAQSTAIR